MSRWNIGRLGMKTKGKGFSVEFPLPQDVAEEIVKQTMPVLVEVVADKAHELVPRRSGRLEAGLEGRVEQGGLRGAIADHARHAHLVHEGTRAHSIYVRKARSLRFYSGAGYLFRREVLHPGARGQPFLTEAVRQSRDKIEQALAGEGESILAKAVVG